MKTSKLIETVLAQPAKAASLWEQHEGPRIQTRQGQILYDAQDPVTDVFVVLAGRFMLFTGEQAPRPLLRLEGPALAGDIAAATGQHHYTHSARCLDGCSVLLVPSGEINALERSMVPATWFHDVAMRHQRMLATAVNEALPLEQRLARWLRDIRPSSLPEDKELARHLGVSSDRVGRARRALARSGALLTQQGSIRVALQSDNWPMPATRLIHSIGR